MERDIRDLTEGFSMPNPVAEAETKYHNMTRNLSIEQIQSIQNGEKIVIGESGIMHAARQAYHRWQQLILENTPQNVT